MITDLQDFKNTKKYTRIISDLEHILIVLDKSQQAFMIFKHYIPVQEIISVLETNKTLMNIYIKDYSEKLKDVKNV